MATIIKTESYRTSDGQHFTDINKAISHEKKSGLRKILKQGLGEAAYTGIGNYRIEALLDYMILYYNQVEDALHVKVVNN